MKQKYSPPTWFGGLAVFAVLLSAFVLSSMALGAPQANPPVVDGIVDTSYQFVGRKDLGGSGGGTDADAPGNLFRTAANGVCYYAFVVDRTYNDNVYDAVNSAYLLLDGWSSHKFHQLETSDRADFEFTNPSNGATIGYVSMDYLYQSGSQWLSGPGGNDVNSSLTPVITVITSASSMAYNMNNVTWPQKNPSSPDDGRSPDYNFNDSNTPKYQWHMVYEFSINASAFGLGGACADIDEAGAHNSPYKQNPGLGSLGDEVWHDLDGDGVRDTVNGVPSEPGFDSVTLKLYENITNTNGTCDPTGATAVRVTQTDAAGYYGFENLAAGNYCVDVVETTLPTGAWSLTTPYEPYFVSLAAGQITDTVDFGFHIQDYTITKRLNTAEPVRVGDPLSFTVHITNTGNATITVLPLKDTYNTTYLSYVGGSPHPDDNLNDGQIDWSDLTAAAPYGFGIDLGPNQAFAVVVKFIAMKDTTPGSTENVATVHAAQYDSNGDGQPDGTLPDKSDSDTVTIYAPTAMGLAGSAMEVSGDRVLLRWWTDNEVDLLGFNLLRQAGDGAWTQVNDRPIVAREAGQATGAAYSYEDVGLAPGVNYGYVLELVMVDGRVEHVEVASVFISWRLFLPAIGR